jgi:hypothetical protein
MCDYSLTSVPNRSARDGEELVACRFPSGCVGFIGAESLPDDHMSNGGGLRGLKAWLRPRRRSGGAAVCILPGSTLVLLDVDPLLRLEFGLAAAEETVFTRLSPAEFSYRDGLRFRNGKEVTLQRLSEGQRAVVRLRATEQRPIEATTPEEAYA